MRKVMVFALLVLLITGFIWSNSMKEASHSNAQSMAMAESLQPVLDSKEEIAEWKFHDFVRKLAHIAEFFLLGLAVSGFGVSLSAYRKKALISLPILMVLLVAVADEFIQHFTHRGSMVTDVVLDFASSAVGLVLVWLAVWVFACANRARMNGKEKANG